MRSLPRVTPRPLLAGIAATALVALALRPPGPAPLFDLIVCALPFLVFWAFLQALRVLDRTRFEREAPEAAGQGETVLLVHRLVNDGRSALRMAEVEEAGLGSVRARSFFAVVPASGQAEARVRLFLERRGRFLLPGVTLTAGDPFGIFTATRTRAAPQEVLVLPRPRRVAARRILGRTRRRSASVGVRVAREALATEPVSVRDYRPGDPVRHVHWPASARRGALVVKAFAEDRARDALVVLDRTPPSGPRGRLAFERAVALAAGLGLDVLDAGGELTFLAGGETPLRLERLRGRRGQETLLRALAVIETDPRGGELLGLDARAGQDAYLVTGRGSRSGLAAAFEAGRGGLRVVAAEGPDVASSLDVAARLGPGSEP